MAAAIFLLHYRSKKKSDIMIVSQRLGRACTISFHTAYTVWHCTFISHLQAAPALLIPLKMDITKMLRTITQQHK